MFPEPIQNRTLLIRVLYVTGIILALILWLLPLLAIVSTSIRPGSDISSGNYWGIPSRFAMVENYVEVFNPARSPMLRYFINSTLITTFHKV